MRICRRCESEELPDQRQLCDSCRDLARYESKRRWAEDHPQISHWGEIRSSSEERPPVEDALKIMGVICKVAKECEDCPAICFPPQRLEDFKPENHYKKAVSC